MRVKPTLRLKLLGTPKISLAEQPLAESLSSKAQAILYYLAVTGQPQPRIALATLLWGDLPESAARTNLRKALANLREVLGDYLELDHQEISFKSKEQLWVDVVEFEASVSALRQPTESQPLQEAVNLYGGDFLTGFYVLHAPDFESWMVAEQERLRELVIQALQALADGYAGQEAWPAGLACLRRLLSLEPWREEAQRQVMLFLAYSGQRSAALAQFESCRRALEEELGVEPGPETVRLYEQIREGKVGPKMAEPTGVIQGRLQAEPEPASPTPLPASPPPIYKLPAASTPFVGRAAEVADILRRLTDKECRLLTLVGPGGIGKTRMALQAAQAFIDSKAADEGFFANGIVFVSLVEVSSASGMVSAIAKAVNFTFHNNGAPRQQLLNYLRGKNMLLVLDNLEHLLEESAPLISETLAVAPEIKLLVTSRGALNLQEAWFHPVEGMSFPGELEANVSLERYDAVQLFVQSAGRVRVGFSLAADQMHVVRICQLVEGMPLGLELAAAWLKALPAAKIVQEIERGLEILTTRLRNMPERHHSLQAVFEQSWQLLTAEEQAVLERLSVFRGSFTDEAAEQVAGASLFSLAVLVEKSLVRPPLSSPPKGGRYQMHELLRQFAGAKLAVDAQAEAVTRERHSAYYLNFLKAREKTMSGPEQQQALFEIGEIIENIRLAWFWAVEQGYLAAIDQAVKSLYSFYQIRSRYQEGLEIFEKAITDLKASPLLKEHPEGERLLKRLLARQGGFFYFLGNYELAHDLLEAGLDSAGQPDEKEFILYLLGDVAVALGNGAMAEAWFRQSLTISQERGNLDGVVAGLRGLAYRANSFGDFVEGKRLAAESLAISRRVGQPLETARTLGTLAWATNCLGEYREAEAYWQESLLICQEIGDRWGTANNLSLLGWSAWCEGGTRLAEAVAYHKKALAICREIGYRRDVAMCLGDLALAASEMGDYEQATQYSLEGLAIAEEINHLDMIIYNLYALGAATCGLGDFQASRAQLLKAIKIAREVQIVAHLTTALFYLALLLVKESGLAGVAEPIQARQKVRALELLNLITHHPACWQAIKDRAAPFQAHLEAELPPAQVTAAKIRAKERTIEEVVVEILAEDPTGFQNP